MKKLYIFITVVAFADLFYVIGVLIENVMDILVINQSFFDPEKLSLQLMVPCGIGLVTALAAYGLKEYRLTQKNIALHASLFIVFSFATSILATGFGFAVF